MTWRRANSTPRHLLLSCQSLVVGVRLTLHPGDHVFIPEFTSRKGDPQLHVHGLVSSKVWEPATERWLALDARELKQDQQAMSAMFHAGLEARLSQDLGVTWGAREYRYARTINGISQQLVDALSQRNADIEQRLETKLSRFEEQLGHGPSPQQKWRLEREAAVDSRPTKTGEHLDFAGWQTTIESHTGMASAEFVASVTGAQGLSQNISQTTIDNMTAATLGELSDTKSSWTRGDFKAELARVLPPDLAGSPTNLVTFINAQTDKALKQLVQVTPDGVDVPNRRWTTPEILGQETRILERVDQVTQIQYGPNPTVAEHAPQYLDELQLTAAERVASHSEFELVVGLAGAGKTSMLKTAVETLGIEQRGVFGLAPSSTAAQVLADETGMPTDNVAKFLWEHTQRNNGPSPEFDMQPGETLIIDEAGMVSTPQWDTLTSLAQTNGWRIVAVGDGYQFSAIGRGGIFDHLTSTLPSHRISRLEQVHRFDAQWEATASTQLRTGDTSVLDIYEHHGRIIPTGDQDLVDVVTGLYLERHKAGVEVGVFAATNQQITQLNTAIQTALADSGRLGPVAATSPTVNVHVGDVIETRHNDRTLETDRHQYVKNRDRWTVTGATNNGLVVTGTTGTVTLPADYIAQHINLAYAQTAHASQGRTISGTSIYAYNPDQAPTDQAPTDRAGIYVPLTRGRQENLAVVHADTTAIAKAHIADAISRRWVDTPAISRLHEQITGQVPLEQQTAAARETLETYEQQSLFDTAAPSPTINPEAPVEGATRSEAQGRQHHHEHVEPVRLDMAHFEALLAERSQAHSHVYAAQSEVQSLQDWVFQATREYDHLTQSRDRHRDEFNKLSADTRIRGRKDRQTQMDYLDTRISEIDQRRQDLQTDYQQAQQSLLPAAERNLETATTNLDQVINKIRDERIRYGHTLTTNPTIVQQLGNPGTQPSQAWLEAAGAIGQYQAALEQTDRSIQQDVFHPTPTLGRQAKALTEAIQPPTLGLDIGLSL